MTTTLTKRDEQLLLVLGCVLLLVLTYMFIVKPGLERADTLNGEVLNAQMQKDDMDQKTALIPSLKQVNEKQKSTWTETSSRFYDDMENQEVDKMITNLVLDQGINPTTLSVSPESSISTLQLYSPGTSGAASSDANAMVYQNVLYYPVGIQVQGEQIKLEDLVDKLSNDYPAVRVVNYSYSGNSESDKTDAQLSMSLEFYMKDNKTLENEDTEETGNTQENAETTNNAGGDEESLKELTD